MNRRLLPPQHSSIHAMMQIFHKIEITRKQEVQTASKYDKNFLEVLFRKKYKNSSQGQVKVTSHFQFSP